MLATAGSDTTERAWRIGRKSPCVPPHPLRTDTLLAAQDGRPVALRLSYSGGGQATLVAEPAFFTNRALKETDAGPLVIPWLLAGRPPTRRVVVDEYHHGFGDEGSLFGAALGWLFRTPAGWAMLQLAAAGLVALAVAAVRFGPALHVIERRRRSPLEHLDALAAGLDRAGAREASVTLLVAGLRRRLSRAGGTGGSVRARPTRAELREWLRSLELVARTPREGGGAQDAVRRLARCLDQPGGDEQVLAAATAVEDVWQALRPQDMPGRSSTRFAASS